MSQEKPDQIVDGPIQISIDQLNVENSKLIFTISMKTILPQYGTKEAQVKRKRADFSDLHRILNDNPNYAGLIIPPIPPETDFSVDRDCLAVFTEDENPNSPEYQIMKKELEREYLTRFKKVLYLHGYFLSRIASSPLLRIDSYVIEFLTSNADINFTPSNSWSVTNIFGGFKKKLYDTLTYAFTEDIADTDDFFEQTTRFVNVSIEGLRKCVSSADELTLYQKRIANIMIKLGSEMQNIASYEDKIDTTFSQVSKFYDRVRNIESAISSDEDLKLSDTLKYHLKNSEAIKDTLNRRMDVLLRKIRSEHQYKAARDSNNNVGISHNNFENDSKEFDNISEKAKEEIKRDSKDRILNLKTNLTQYCNLEIKNNKNMIEEIDKLLENI